MKPTPEILREILTPREVAEEYPALRVTARTVTEMFRRGQLRGFRVGTRYRIYRASVEGLLEGSTR